MTLVRSYSTKGNGVAVSLPAEEISESIAGLGDITSLPRAARCLVSSRLLSAQYIRPDAMRRQWFMKTMVYVDP